LGIIKNGIRGIRIGGNRMNKFYVIKPEEGIRFGRKWAYAEIMEPINKIEAERCPVCGVPIGFYKWMPPYRIYLSSVKSQKWGDFIWGAGFSLLVSENFKRIYTEENLTGIEKISIPVEIGKMGNRKLANLPTLLPIYHLIYVPWGLVNQDDEKSKLNHEQPEKIKCPYCRRGQSWRKQQGIIIDENSWHGEDIFKPRGSPFELLVSERFKQVVENYRLKNIWFIPAENYCYDERRFEIWYVRS